VPLLFETGLEKIFDKVIVVSCPLNILNKRITKRDKIPKAEGKLRIKSQMDIRNKKRKADYLIINSKTKINLKQKTTKIWEEINYGCKKR